MTYQATILADAPSFYWRLGDGYTGSNVVRDASGNGNHGTLGGPTNASNSGVVGLLAGASGATGDGDGALGVNGAHVLVTPTTPASLSGSYTVALLVPNGVTGPVFGTRGPNDTTFDIQLGANGAGSQIHCDIGNGASWLTTAANASFTWPATSWWHIAVAVTPTGWTIYVNGVSKASGSFSGTPLLYDANHHVYLGWDGFASDAHATPPSGSALAGLDELSVFPSALSATTISDLAGRVGNAAGATSYASGVLAQSPTLYLRLGPGTGVKTVADASGNGRDGIPLGGWTSAAGLLVGDTDSAETSDGSSAYLISQTAYANSDFQSSVIEGWLKTTTAGVLFEAVGSQNIGRPGTYGPLVLLGTDGKLTVEVAGAGSTRYSATSTAAYNDGARHHVAARCVGGATYELYVDGALVASVSSIAFTMATASYWRVGMGATATYPVGFGGDIGSLAAILDEIAFYPGTSLSASQIAAHHTAGLTQTLTPTAWTAQAAGAATLSQSVLNLLTPVTDATDATDATASAGGAATLTYGLVLTPDTSPAFGAQGHATASGSALLTQSLPLPPPGGYAVTIGGAQVSVLAGTLDLTNEIGQRSTARFTCRSAAGVRYDQGTAVSISDGAGTLIYAGFVDTDQATKPGFAPLLEHQIACVDNHYLADKRLAYSGYLGQSAGAVVRSLWGLYLQAEGVTLGSIAEGPTIAEKVWSGEPVSSAMDWLAQVTGYWWEIDAHKRLTFSPYGASLAPWVLDGTQADQASVTVTYGNRQYRNRQFVDGGFDTIGPLTETFHGTGTARAFTLSYAVSSVKSIILNGVAQNLGVKGRDSGQPFYYAVGDAVIAQDAARPLLGSGDTLVVTYQGRYPVRALAQNAALITRQRALEGTGTGYVEVALNERNIHSLPAAFQIAQAQLAHFGQRMTTLVFQTRLVGLTQGMLLTVQLPVFGLDQQMLIRSVEIADSDGLNIWYTVTAIGSPYDVSWQTFFTNLMNQATGALSATDAANTGGADVLALLTQISVASQWTITFTSPVFTPPLCGDTTICGPALLIG